MNSFFPRKLYRTAALLYLLLFLAVGAASAGSAWVEAPKDRRFLGVMIFSTFWGAWAIAAAWMLLASYRSYLHVWGDNLIWQGAFFLREIGIHDITAARWKSMHKGSLRLFTPKARLTIDFDLFEPEERIWLIQFFRSRLPDSIQHDWGRFCLTVALPLREPEPPAPRQLPADKILITRRRWDWYFIPFILVFALIGLVLFLALQQPRMLAAPLIPILLWLCLRFTTPKVGHAETRIERNPEVMRFLLGVLLWGVLGIAGVFLFDVLGLPKAQADIAGPAVLFGWMGLLLGVAIWRARLADRELRKQEVVKVEKAVQRWDEMDAEAGGTMAGETQGEP